MARVLQIRRGTSAQNDNFTGLSGEITFDTDAKTLRVHDGQMLGGYALARADAVVAGPGNGDGDGFDIYSVPDDFWESKITEFASSSSFTVLTSNAVLLRSTTYIEYIFDTDKVPLFADAVLVCEAADAGYRVGDLVSAYGFGAYTASQPIVFSDASGVHARLMIGNRAPWVCHRDTGAVTNTADNAWKIQFRLYC